MPHSSNKNVDAAMDAWDRQRCGLALLAISKHLDLLNYHAGEPRDDQSRAEIASSIERVRTEIRKFIDESE